MAHVGMKYPVAAPLTEANGAASYADGFVIGKAIEFSGNPNSNDVELWADDGIAETDKSLKNLETSMNVDDLSLKVQADLLGHTYTAAVDAVEADNTATPPVAAVAAVPEGIVIKESDTAPFYGEGFYKRRKKNGVITYTVVWLHKVQHTRPAENAATKGENIEFQTDTINGKAYPLDSGEIYEKHVFTTEAAAIAWLNDKADISA